ncbi:MAG TPA: hypothetical protein VMU36_12535 [Spirochaetia bacterium]|nr:hypothetical protein [Spirochaetia bacterium]
MVKTRAISLILCAASLAGCGLLTRSERASPQQLVIARGRLGRTVSLLRTTEMLVAVYSDQETAGLYWVEIPVSDTLPGEAPSPEMIDRIALIPPLPQSFGAHSAFARGNGVSVLYQARGAEEKPVLKLASWQPGAQAWTLDVIEPAGDPVAILPGDKDHLDLFWGAASLLWQSYPGNAKPSVLQSPFTPAERASVFDRHDEPVTGTTLEGSSSDTRGLTVYDSASSALLAVRWNGSAYDAASIVGAGPIHSSLLLPDGRLAVLSWESTTRRLQLLKQKPGEAFASRSLVTLSQDTNTVALLEPPGQESVSSRDASRLFFLYDETRVLGGGKEAHELSLLSPGWGGRYQRTVLASDDQPIADFSALEVGDTLYVLVHQDVVKLLKVKLPR